MGADAVLMVHVGQAGAVVDTRQVTYMQVGAQVQRLNSLVCECTFGMVVIGHTLMAFQPVVKLAESQSAMQTGRQQQTDRQTDRQADRQTGRQTDR